MKAPAPLTVLVVDDEPRSLETLRRTLEEDFTVFTAASAEEGEAVMAREFVHIVLSDQRMPGTQGVEFLRRVRSQWPDTVRLILSGYTDAEDIIAGINHAGIWQYLLKPWHPEQLLLTLKSAADLWRLQQENQRLSLDLRDDPEQLVQRVAHRRGKLMARSGFDRLARAADSPLNAVCELAQKIAGHELSVLITGESGTGKELFARTLHEHSGRGERPFLAINCGAFNEELLANELFGHEKGAFTGAVGKSGLLLAAHGGTLFLDEVTEMSPAMQVKLLRAIQEKEVLPLGGTRPVKVDVRFIAASNRNMKDWVADGRFRQDLFYRLNVVNLHIPPLSQRREDIPLLAQHFLDRAAPVMGKPVRHLAENALALLKAYDFPGNVRELENIIERGVALCQGDTLEAAHLPDDLRDLSIRAFRRKDGKIVPLEEQERDYILWVLEEAHGNQTLAAQMLGIDRVSLWRKLKKYGEERSG